MRIFLQPLIWIFLFGGVVAGGAFFLLCLMFATSAMFMLVRNNKAVFSAMMIIFILFSILSMLGGNPSIGVFLTLLCVVFSSHYAMILNKGNMSKYIIYFCIMVACFPIHSEGWRYSGVFLNPNNFSAFVCANMAMFFVLGYRTCLVGAVIFLLSSICVLQSGSRSWGVVSLFFTLVIFVKHLNRLERASYVKPLFLFFSFLPIAYVYFETDHMSVFIYRLSALFDGGDGSTGERLANVGIAMKGIVERPLFGHGISGFYILSGEVAHSHSTLLETFVSFGVVLGTIIIIPFSLVIAILLFRPLYYSLSRLEGLGLSGYFTVYFFFDSIYSNVFALTIFFILCYKTFKVDLSESVTIQGATKDSVGS